MRTAQIDIRAADRGHAHLVIRTRMETGERIEEWNLAARGGTHANADHILFGDVPLAETVRVGVAKNSEKVEFFTSRNRNNVRIH